jgi:hypothetical protein
VKIPAKAKGVHESCLLTCDCVKTTDFCVACLRCGFSKPEAERRQKLPLTFCEDGLRREFVGVDDAGMGA